MHDGLKEVAVCQLQQGGGIWGTFNWSYDGVGNRTSEALSSGYSNTYNYAGSNNQLASLTQGGTTVRAFSYDGAGNLITDSNGSTTYNYAYNNRGRLATLTIGSTQTSSYFYDGLERLAIDASPNLPLSGITQYVYDQAGHLLAESDDTGATLTEYVWLDDMPIALVANVAISPSLYYVHVDHLDRPIMMTDANKSIVWQADYNPFGGVNSITGSATNNLRFPGQYFLMESGLHYNWYRQYDPTIGRYIQPDPLQDVLMTASAPTAASLASYNIGDIGAELPGFAGGPSIYAYVDSDPMSQVDDRGLVPLDKLFGLPRAFWKWYHRQVKRPGDPDLTKEEAEECYNEWKQLGQPGPDSAGSSSDNENNNKFAVPPWLWLLPLLVPFPGNPVYGGF